ncbi:growth arrest and DNA damage inducible [Echinococcus multilocularis]|uniref:Large ribosomal subunit protein mL64 n=1 Tax=Echinococcus multilocularis TaxID=6211 RepID=A0A087W0B0_ECHMU|nr:growth arrest and DNA damage inducible [Echinococcus multilocularis]
MFSVSSPCHKLLFLCVPSRSKKYYPGWRDPFSLTDYDNLSKGYPSVTDQWEAEWSSTKAVPCELKAFDVNRLPHHLIARNRRIPLPVKYDHEQRPAYQRRLFGIYGLSSSVNPCELFDSYEYLAREGEIKKRLEPDIGEFKRRRIEANAAKAKVEEERIRKITENLERMPEILEKYRANQEKKAQAAQVQEEKRRQLLDEARDRFGYYVDHRDPKFLKLVEEKHEEARLAKKASKKK